MIAVAALPAAAALALGPVAYAAGITPTNVPNVDLNAKAQTSGSPFGYFKLIQCDGPDFTDLTPTQPPTKILFDGQYYAVPPNPPGYVPCNFASAMGQVQYLINAMVVLGVVAAIVGLGYAGFLYLTGVPANINKAKSIFPKMAIGFALMLTAWFIVYQILVWLTGGTKYLK